MEIEYKIIPIAPDYKISNIGDVISLKNNKQRNLKVTIEKSGYKVVGLRENGKYIRKRIHQLVALCFVDNPQNYNEVNHKDADKSNNTYTNLEWCTHTENIRHSFAMGLVSRKSGKQFHGYDKGVKVIVSGKIFNSIAGASRKLNIPRSSLSGELNGNRVNKSGIQPWK